MVQRVKKSRPAPRSRDGVQPRELLLAGLGAVSLARKQGIKLVERLRRDGGAARASVEQRAQAAYADLFENLGRIRGEVESRVRPMAAEAEARAGVLWSQVETRLSPLLGRFDRSPAVPRRARTVAVNRTAGRKVAPKRTGRAV